GEGRLALRERLEDDARVLEDPLAVLAGDRAALGHSFGEAHREICLLLPREGEADLASGHQVDVLRLERAVVDPEIEPGAGQMLIRNLRPLRTPGEERAFGIPLALFASEAALLQRPRGE